MRKQPYDPIHYLGNRVSEFGIRRPTRFPGENGSFFRNSEVQVLDSDVKAPRFETEFQIWTSHQCYQQNAFFGKRTQVSKFWKKRSVYKTAEKQ